MEWPPWCNVHTTFQESRSKGSTFENEVQIQAHANAAAHFLSFCNHGEPSKMVWICHGLNAVKGEIYTAQ